MKKIVVSILLAIASSAVMADTNKVIRFGIDPSYPPFESKTPTGEVDGFDVDLGNAICATLKVKCVWVQNTFDGMIPGLKAGKFDAILSAMNVTEKRKQEIAFTDKLYHTPSFLIAKTGSLTDDVGALKGKRIGVELGSIQEAYVKSHWEPNGISIVTYQNTEAAFDDLKFGRIDGAVTGAVLAEKAFLNTAQGQGFSLIGNALRDEKILGVGTGIGLRKENDTLRQEINAAIATLLANGEYQRMARKYFTFDIYNGS